MHELDDTDMELLRLLTEDARRPYNEMADVVDLSPPAVRDRIERLQEVGVIRGFTIDIDRSLLDEGLPVLVTLDMAAELDEASDVLAETESVEHVYVTADARLIVHARVLDGDVRGFLRETIDMDTVRSYEVSLLDTAQWTPHLAGASFALECAECGNTVTAEGESARLDGALYHFCCGSCEERFLERYQELSGAA